MDMTHNRIRMSDLKHWATLLLGVLVLASILLSALGAPPNQAKAAGAPVVFRVDANGNITANGTPIRVKGGSWFGLQGRHEPSTDATNPSGAPMEQYMGNVFWNSTTRTYDQDIAEFKTMGINVIRLPLVPQTLTGTDPQGMAPYLKNTESVRIANSRLALETIIKKLDAAGIYVLLDIHSCSNYVDWRKGRLDARPPYVDATRDNYDFKREDSSCAATNNPSSVTRIQAYDETKWLADLKTLAGLEASLGVSNIIGIDIYNEPWDYTWAEWKTLTEHAYTAINSVNPNILIFMEGISDSANNQDGIVGNEVVSPSGSAPAPNWGGNLYSAGDNPPAIPKDRLVYSPHVYGPSVFVGKQFVDNTVSACVGLSGDAAGDAKCPLIMPSAATLAAGWDSQFGYLKAQGYAIVIGEWGGNMDWPKGKASLRDQARFSYVTDTTLDQQWQNIFVDYLISKGIYDTIYWSINPESGDTGGLYTTPYDPVSNTSAWGTWGALDSRKMTLVRRLWDVPVNPGPTSTPTTTATVTATATGPKPTITATPTITRTSTVTSTPTITLTPSGNLKVQLQTGGTDNNQQTAFRFRVQNSGTSAQPNISVRLYFTTDGSNAASAYVLEKYYDQSGVAAVSGPTLATGNIYYFTVNYGTASLAVGSSWEYQTALHLSSWGSTYNGANDWWHTSSAIPASYADWPSVPAYVSGSRVWGSEPVTGPTNTPTPTSTSCAQATAEPLWVDPVTSPTNQTSQVITVRVGNSDSVTVTHEFGSTTLTGNFSTTNPALVTVPLQANATHHLTVSAHIKSVPGPGGCSYGNYTLSTGNDRYGALLTIIQTSGTVTPSPTLTATATPTATGTQGPGTCSPVTATITAPFTKDGAGTFCWQTSNLGGYINSWNLANLTINGVDFTNKYASSSSYPAKINGFWYVSYTGNFAWSHFEAK
jgi:endoglucanase